jgi:hypothetical protein
MDAGRRHLPGVVPAVFLLGSLVALAWFGVRVAHHTRWYLAGAADLLAGRPLDAPVLSRLAYFLVVALRQQLGFGLTGVVVVQISAAAAVLTVLYRTGAALAGEAAGVIAMVLSWDGRPPRCSHSP